MPQIVLCLTRKEGTTPEQFKQHYETSHAPLAMKHLGHLYKSYQRNYADFRTPTLGEREQGVSQAAPLYDCITVIQLEDDAALDEFWRIGTSPGMAELFAEDEEKFLDREKLVIHICHEVTTAC